MNLIDFDTVISMDEQNIKLIRKGEVFREENGTQAKELRKKLVKIHDLDNMGFVFRSFEFDGVLNEWYEYILVDASKSFEAVTLIFHPERELFEVAESGITFTEIQKAEAMIKAFRI